MYSALQYLSSYSFLVQFVAYVSHDKVHIENQIQS